MVFFSWFKGIFSKKTKWKNDKNKLIERLSRGKFIKLNTCIIVEEGQNAIIVGNNKMCDLFYPGEYILTPATLPRVNKVCKLSKPHKNFRTKKLEYPQRFRGDIIYVNTKELSLDFITGTLKIKEKGFGTFNYKIEYQVSISVESIKQFGKHFISKVSEKDDKSYKRHIQRIINYNIKRLLKSKLKIQDIIFNDSVLSEIINTQSISLSNIGLKLNGISIKQKVLSKRTLKKLNKNIDANNFELCYYDCNLKSVNESKDTIKEMYVLPSKDEIYGLNSIEDENNVDVDYNPLFDNCNKQEMEQTLDNNFQSNDSNSIINRNICFNCGAELFEGAIFCHKCGVKLLEGEEDD